VIITVPAKAVGYVFLAFARKETGDIPQKGMLDKDSADC
jgi:hypothetical protein